MRRSPTRSRPARQAADRGSRFPNGHAVDRDDQSEHDRDQACGVRVHGLNHHRAYRQHRPRDGYNALDRCCHGATHGTGNENGPKRRRSPRLGSRILARQRLDVVTVNSGIRERGPVDRGDLAMGATQTFVATVTGSTNTAATWSVSSGTGSINSSTGVFTAPALTETDTILATASADSGRTGTASANIAPAVTATSIGPFGAGYKNLVGTVGFMIYSFATGALTLVQSRTTTGVVESITDCHGWLRRPVLDDR